MKLTDDQRSFILAGLDGIRSHAVDNDDIPKADAIQMVEKIVRTDTDQCLNCRTTERNLAQAYLKLGLFLRAAGVVIEAEKALAEAKENLGGVTEHVNRWLEAQQ